MRRLLIAFCMVGLMASTGLALPLGGPLYNSVEDFDDYTVSPPDDANYVANWVGTRPPVGSPPSPFSAPNCALIATGVAKYRASYDLEPDINAIDSEKHTVNGTDDNGLVVSFNMDSNSSTVGERKACAFNIELSKGDVAAPAYDGTTYSPPLPVMSWGWFGDAAVTGYGLPKSAAPYFFNGAFWTNIAVDQKNGLNDLTATIKTNTVIFDNSYDAYGSDTKDRGYLGCFDTITMRSVGNDLKYRRVDDVAIGAGELRVPEPATLSFLALGGLMLLRRRR